MRSRLLLGALIAGGILAAVFAVPTNAVRAAQKGPGGTEGAVMGMPTARAATPFEEFAGRLKLDEKTQLLPARDAFLAAATEAGTPGREMLQLRQKLLNQELNGQTGDEKATLDAYTAAAIKMASLEAAAMVKVQAMLKPDQQTRIPQAYVIVMGMFQPPGGSSGRGR